jgi:protein arginine N-methyltransferase 1
MTYSLRQFGGMIADAVRMEAYEEALRRAVFPGATVLDLGCGSGIFSFLALRLGAGHVYAIDPAPAIQVGMEIARENGASEDISFYQAMSTDIDLPEQVDVVIADLRGVLPFIESHIPSLIDARTRLMKVGGTLIPQGDSLWMGVVTMPKKFDEINYPWSQKPYGFDMTAASRYLSNGWYSGRAGREQLLSEPAEWARLDYRTIDSPNAAGEAILEINHSGTAHGLLIWFDATLLDDVGFSNTPGVEAHPTVYGSAFFPWPRAVEVEIGDSVSAAVEVKLVGESYVWRWRSKIKGQNGEEKARFEQGSFFANPLSLEALRRKKPDFVPGLNRKGEIARCTLELVDGRLSNEAIAAALLEKYPEAFPDRKAALTYVTNLLADQGYGA